MREARLPSTSSSSTMKSPVTFPLTLMVFSPIFMQDEKQSPCSMKTPVILPKPGISISHCSPSANLRAHLPSSLEITKSPVEAGGAQPSNGHSLEDPVLGEVHLVVASLAGLRLRHHLVTAGGHAGQHPRLIKAKFFIGVVDGLVEGVDDCLGLPS